MYKVVVYKELQDIYNKSSTFMQNSNKKLESPLLNSKKEAEKFAIKWIRKLKETQGSIFNFFYEIKEYKTTQEG